MVLKHYGHQGEKNEMCNFGFLGYSSSRPSFHFKKLNFKMTFKKRLFDAQEVLQ
jgi:hypothetical protein